MTDGPPLPPDGETSFELLMRARTGHPDAIDRLCAYYRPRLRRWARGRLPSNARGALDTEDVVQEVLIRAIGHIATFDTEGGRSFQCYLREALKNRLIDETRKARIRPVGDPLGSVHPSDEPSPLERAVGSEAVARYEAGLARLRDEDQQLIVARCEWGMSHREVAQLIGKTPGAAQVAVHRALVRLAKEMAVAPRA